MGWIERYRNGRLDGIAVEWHAILKTSSGIATLLRDITGRERKVARHYHYGCFFTEQSQLLQDLNPSYQETRIVLNELWVLLGEENQQPYVSQAAYERRKSHALQKILGSPEVRKEDTHPPCGYTFDHTPVIPGEEIGFGPLRSSEEGYQGLPSPSSPGSFYGARGRR